MDPAAIKHALDELAGWNGPLILVLRDGTEIRGVIAERDAESLKLENPPAEVSMREVEKILIEAVTEGPE